MDAPNDFVPSSPSVSAPVYPPVVIDEPEQPELQTGRQKARAAVTGMQLHPAEMLAKLCTGFKKANMRIVENIRGHYAVPQGTQPDGILSDEYLAGMKRAASQISRSQYEIYSCSTRHNLSEAATDEPLQLLTNVSSVQL
jgi:hypothetical protein